MGRLVRRSATPSLDQQIAGLDGGDSYVERAIKYIPAEVLGFFMLINAILDQAMKSGGPNAAMAGVPIMVIATGALAVGCILTPLFCWYVRKPGDAWVLNAAVSTIAFLFWSYLIGAVAFASIHDGNLAVILVATFTVVSGLVSPLPGRAALTAAQQQPAPQQTTPMERPRLFSALDVA